MKTPIVPPGLARRFSARRFLPVLLLLTFAGSAVAEEKNAAQEEAIAAIKKMKGDVVVDRKRPGQPVTEVHLYAGRTAGIGLAPLERLPEIEWIGLHDSDITDAELEHLKGLTKLKRLGLAHLGFTDASLERIAGMTALEILFLMENPVTDAGLDHLQKMTKLKQLGLGLTKITDAGLAKLVVFKELETLDLQGLKITEAGLAHLAALTHMQALDLHDCVGVRDLKALRGWRLVSLNATHLNSVTDFTPLAGMPLTNLDLTGTQIENLSVLRGMPLTSLNCSDTPVSDLSPLEGCKELKTLRAQRTKVTADGVAALQKALPNCKIEWEAPPH